MSDSDAFNSDMLDTSTESSGSDGDMEDWQGRLQAAEAKDEERKKEAKMMAEREERNKNRVTFDGEIDMSKIDKVRVDMRRREAMAMNNVDDLLGGISDSSDDDDAEGREDLDIMGIDGEEKKLHEQMLSQAKDSKKTLDGMVLEVKTDYNKFEAMLTDRLIQIHNNTVVDGGVDENGVMFFEMIKNVVSNVLLKCCYPEDAKELSAVCARVQQQIIEDEKKRKGIKTKKVVKKGPQIKQLADNVFDFDFM